MTPSQKARLGGLALSASHDPNEYTKPARAAFLRRFWPDDDTLEPAEAERRAKAALRLHMTRLALRRSKSGRLG